MSHFFAYLARMKHIMRWGLMRNTSPENIQEHSHQVAIITHALATIKNRRFGGAVDVRHAVMLAVFHEASEVITGDLATPIKYFNPSIRDAYKQIEQTANAKLISMLPEDLRGEYEPVLCPPPSAEYQIMKAADKICAYIKCLDELKAGNHEFSKAVLAIERSIRELRLPEVDCFMAEFAPSFSLTLDELN